MKKIKKFDDLGGDFWTHTVRFAKGKHFEHRTYATCHQCQAICTFGYVLDCFFLLDQLFACYNLSRGLRKNSTVETVKSRIFFSNRCLVVNSLCTSSKNVGKQLEQRCSCSAFVHCAFAETALVYITPAVTDSSPCCCQSRLPSKTRNDMWIPSDIKQESATNTNSTAVNVWRP